MSGSVGPCRLTCGTDEDLMVALFSYFAGTMALLLVLYFASGTHSRPLAAALAIAALCSFIFREPVDTWITQHIYPKVGHLAADCFMLISLALLSSIGSPRATRRKILTLTYAIIAGLCVIFFAIPQDELVDRISVHMFQDPRFFVYAMLVNIGITLLALVMWRAEWVSDLGVTPVLLLIRATAMLSIFYIASRILAPLGLVSPMIAVVVSTALASILSGGLALVVIWNITSLRRNTRRRTAELEALREHLAGPYRMSLCESLWGRVNPTARLVDLIAELSDRIALLPPDDPIRIRAMAVGSESLWGSSNRHGGLAAGHSIAATGASLFAIARSVREDSHGTYRDRRAGSSVS
ncbi:hypothetical protein ACFWPX_16280 [Nocardia sp. NPDC058518]|uniref:hypothetical protein n=1 Tax=Nocardia sp. NPDC058518 TaxID=3346534 RepID=UPI0036641EC4